MCKENEMMFESESENEGGSVKGLRKLLSEMDWEQLLPNVGENERPDDQMVNGTSRREDLEQKWEEGTVGRRAREGSLNY